MLGNVVELLFASHLGGEQLSWLESGGEPRAGQVKETQVKQNQNGDVAGDVGYLVMPERNSLNCLNDPVSLLEAAAAVVVEQKL